ACRCKTRLLPVIHHPLHNQHHHKKFRNASPRGAVCCDDRTADDMFGSRVIVRRKCFPKLPDTSTLPSTDVEHPSSYSPCSPSPRKTASRARIAWTISIDIKSIYGVLFVASSHLIFVNYSIGTLFVPTYMNGIDVDLTVNATAVVNDTHLLIFSRVISFEGAGGLAYMHEFDDDFEEGDEPWPFACSHKSNWGQLCQSSY
ncbi:uncharacterized protein V1518DRAFT_447290, partial [Limtongia smithiae]|uniref:uncharacterized protein n=1 Tax=Limtongia smithiae TaxID=1125753 RepID=UPI0034CD38DC